ncbi:MAG: NAD(P)/FAD-dependent oxidoreductase [Candidatus Latescibacterota bacterium]|nr:MAG: NAD(P)/FAD-dependent oxidoreductase [Candidatus Latescibacterota bacterium]
MTRSRYLIIGNSAAGVAAVEAIRQADGKGAITVVSDEDVVNYSRPLISYYLGGRVSEDRMAFRDRRFYERNEVALILGRKAEELDVERRRVVLSDGTELGYEKLLIATGGRPIIPPMDGLRKVREGAFTFTRLSDAKEMLKYIRENEVKEAVVLGAGLIGLKATEGLVERGIKVTIVELADRILANTLDREASAILERALGNWGCKVIKEDTISRVISSRGRVREVVLRSGRSLSAPLLVIAVGVRPNLELVEDTPINYDRGITVDEHMRTNVEDVYAAGDVAQARDFLTGWSSVIAIWPVAFRQGKVAGWNMAGRETRYEGLFPMNSVELAGIPTISFGTTNPPEADGYEILARKDEESCLYRKIVLKENKVVGAIFLGRIERAGIFSGLIKDGIDVSSFKEELLSDDFGLLVLPAEYRKHMVKGEGMEV